MPTLNPNAGEFVPNFPSTSTSSEATAPITSTGNSDNKRSDSTTTAPTKEIKTAAPHAAQGSTQTSPPVIGIHDHGRHTYSVQELLQYQPLYRSVPPGFNTTQIPAKAASTKSKSKRGNRRHDQQLPYDPTLVCYFNPNEYSAAMHMGLFTSPGTSSTESASKDVKKATQSPIEEAVNAKRKLATLLDEVDASDVNKSLVACEDLVITCPETLTQVTHILLDHALRHSPSDVYGQLLTGLADRLPTFQDGVKKINFRRILVTSCYEALVETSDLEHPKIRKTQILGNVELVAALFRRQVLPENVLHVCIALLLEEEESPEPKYILAACRLFTLVGDLLDGSSPASRRTMDEYFDVLQRLEQHANISETCKRQIQDTIAWRRKGWPKRRQSMETS